MLMAPEDVFSGLPSEIIMAILSRLSPRAIALSKCVCKAWQDLLGSDYFLDSYHHSKSAAALAVMLPYSDHDPDWFKVFEVEDRVDYLQSNNPITKFGPPLSMPSVVVGSANGLVFLYEPLYPNLSFVYNPITREYIEICARQEGYTDAYGFGASKVSGEFKVVRFEFLSDYCHVYTLGTGKWRHFQDATAALIDVSRSSRLGAFVDGNLYWRVSDPSDSDPVYKDLIVCFDVETERFSTFPSPPVRECGWKSNRELFTLKDCLCFLDDTDDDGIGLWLLKECGVEKSWRKECVMKRHPGFGFPPLLLQPIKVFENGDILVLCDQKMFLRYSVKTKTYQEIQSFGAIRERYSFYSSSPFTPSFRSLKSFAEERVISCNLVLIK